MLKEADDTYMTGVSTDVGRRQKAIIRVGHDLVTKSLCLTRQKVQAFSHSKVKTL